MIRVAGCLLARSLLLLDGPAATALAGTSPHLQLKHGPAAPRGAGLPS
jgi:hypothetical protein